MFTGIIAEIGKVYQFRHLSQGLEMRFQAPQLAFQLAIGDSIAINGVCSTAIDIQPPFFTVQYSTETLYKTRLSDLKIGESVNLELSLTPETRIGGHFVLGHVDETGSINKVEHQQAFHRMEIRYNSANKQYIVPKGSITIDGISLTISGISEELFSCHIIPHTFTHTTLTSKKQGDLVHLEYDILGKYVSRLLSQGGNTNDLDTRLLQKLS